MQDAVIIGGGPAGASAAKFLVERGYSVTLLERCKLPRNKPCSGILIGKTLNLVREHFGDIPHSVTCAPAENRGMVFYDDGGREYRFEQKGLNVWRSRFDDWLLGKARERGVSVIEKQNVIAVESKGEYAEIVLANGEKMLARFVVDCSGAAGGLQKEQAFIFIYQVFYRGTCSLDPHYFYAFTNPHFSEYDAWYNVKDNMPVAGVAVKNPHRALRFHEKFIAYLRESCGFLTEQVVRTERWVMPRVHRPCKINYGHGRILCAGEAAGFLNPMGEGISSAIASGVLAARAIANHDSGAVAFYEESAREVADYMSRQWGLVSRMSERFRYMGEEEYL